jgi:methylenetetrahydrofolate reductase (NADPH)
VELVTTRGTLDEAKAVQTRDFARELAEDSGIDWVSITDNAGGNPQLSPVALGKPLLYAGKEVVIHLSCKDFNRNGLESAAWTLASEGFHNILALTGDYPVTGYSGNSKPVFDIDSVGLLTLLNEMNHGLGVPISARNGHTRRLQQTDFYTGAVVTNFKRHENEVVPQYLKLRKKIEVGAQFIISQIGFDAGKYSELIAYLHAYDFGHVPVIGNIFLMNERFAAFFNKGRMPGVVVSDEFLRCCRKAAAGSDQGRRFFRELAAKQMAIFRGLGYAGVYFGGVDRAEDLHEILSLEKSFSPDDWKQFAKEIQFSQPGEFFYFDKNPDTGLADARRLHPDYAASLRQRRPTHNVTFNYRFSKWAHDQAFTPGKALFRLGSRIYNRSKTPAQGPKLLRLAEHLSKSALFGCKDCGDCSLPDTGYLCPESSCVKNQRNGPCGGTRDGKCEIEEFECIWARTYDRLKAEGREQHLLDHAPVIQDQGLRGTSAWSNTFRQKDHHSRRFARVAAGLKSTGPIPSNAL